MKRIKLLASYTPEAVSKSMVAMSRFAPCESYRISAKLSSRPGGASSVSQVSETVAKEWVTEAAIVD